MMIHETIYTHTMFSTDKCFIVIYIYIYIYREGERERERLIQSKQYGDIFTRSRFSDSAFFSHFTTRCNCVSKAFNLNNYSKYM